MLVEFVIDQLYDSGRTAEFLEQVHFIDVVFGHRLWKTAQIDLLQSQYLISTGEIKTYVIFFCDYLVDLATTPTTDDV